MKKILLGSAALMAVTFSFGAYAADPAHVPAANVPAAHTEQAVKTEAVEKAATTAHTEQAVEASTIADVASKEAELSTLVSALAAAELTESLKGSGPFTVFAPTNAAFEKLGKEKLTELLKPENKEQLATLLKYHVVPGKIAAVDAKGAAVDLTTLQSGVVKVDGKGDAVHVGPATVTKADVMASNGIIHEIDTVLMPPADAEKHN